MKTFIILLLVVMVMSAAGVSLRDVLSGAPDTKEGSLEVGKRESDVSDFSWLIRTSPVT